VDQEVAENGPVAFWTTASLNGACGRKALILTW
jgi:hypothetical protein